MASALLRGYLVLVAPQASEDYLRHAPTGYVLICVNPRRKGRDFWETHLNIEAAGAAVWVCVHPRAKGWRPGLTWSSSGYYGFGNSIPFDIQDLRLDNNILENIHRTLEYGDKD